jgi:hypothetical protein
VNRAVALGALIATSLLAACGGSGTFPNGSVVNSPGSGGPSQPPPNLVDVKVDVTIPARKQNALRPDYISVNTRSLVIQLSTVNGNPISGVNPKTINTFAHANGCKVAGGETICTATALGSPGNDVFTVTTYDGTNATGSVLSVGTVGAKIHGTGNPVKINQLSLALYGVIAALRLSLSPDSGKRGTRMTSSATLSAYDASGAQIVGPSEYSTPIDLAIQGDTGKAFQLRAGSKSGSSLTILRPTSGITLDYDGNAQASSITVAASVDGDGSIGAGANFTLRGKQPPPPVGTIYALNLGSGSGKSAVVTEYDGKAKGNAAPERTLNLDSKLYARSIAVDASGNLYVGYIDNTLGYDPGTGKPDEGNEVAIYAPDASGNDQPTAVIAADSKTSTTLFPIFLDIDSAGGLVTYGATTIDSNDGDDAVLTYAPETSRPVAPEYAFDFASPSLYYAGPTGLTLDSAGNFYVNGSLHTILGNQYGLYVAPASDRDDPKVSPSRTIPWDSTTELTPGHTTNASIAQSGEIFIGTWVPQGTGSKEICQGAVNVYSAGPSGGSTDEKPLRVLTLGTVAAQGDGCYSSRNPVLPYFPEIQLYGTSLFALDVFNDAIDEFAAGGKGSVKPTLRIVGSATQLASPISFVVTSISGTAKAAPVTGGSRSPVYPR